MTRSARTRSTRSTEVLYVYVMKGSMERGEPLFLDGYGCVTHDLYEAHCEGELGEPRVYKAEFLKSFVRTKILREMHVQVELRLL